MPKENTLIAIKRLIFAGQYRFSEKARDEMAADNISETDVGEAILNAVAIHKELRSTSTRRRMAGEKLYVIMGTNFEGLAIYTKGKIIREGEREYFYFLISSKISE